MLPPAANRLLSRFERYLRIDMRYLLKGGFFLGLSQVGSAVLALGLTIAFANLLPVETYGTYRYLIAVYGLFALAALPGIDTAVLRAVSRGEDGAFDEGVRAKLRWGLLGTAAALLYAGYQFHTGNASLGYGLVVMAAAIPFMESAALYASFLNGTKRFGVWAAFDIGVHVLAAAALLVTMLLTPSIIALSVAYFGSYTVGRVAVLALVRMRYPRTGARDTDMRAYGSSVTLFQIITRAMASIDQVVLFHVLGPAQVAIFSLATAIPNRVQGVFRITGNLAFPKFAAQRETDILAALPRKMALFSIVVLAIGAGYTLVAPWLFAWVFPQYLPSLPYSQVVIFYTLSAITYPFSSYLFAHKRITDNYVLAGGSFIAKATCLILLVPLYGIWGAVAGIMASAAATLIISLWMLRRTSTNNTGSTTQGG